MAVAGVIVGRKKVDTDVSVPSPSPRDKIMGVENRYLHKGRQDMSTPWTDNIAVINYPIISLNGRQLSRIRVNYM